MLDRGGDPGIAVARIAEGRAALEASDATAARVALELALEHGEHGDACFGLAQRCYLDVEYPAAIKAYERAFTVYRAESDLLEAVAAARMLSWLHGNVLGDWAVGNGWLARAASLLEEAGEDCLERGRVEVLRAIAEDDRAVREDRFRVRSQRPDASPTPTWSSRRRAGSAWSSCWPTASRKAWSCSTKRWPRSPAARSPTIA